MSEEIGIGIPRVQDLTHVQFPNCIRFTPSKLKEYRTRQILNNRALNTRNYAFMHESPRLHEDGSSHEVTDQARLIELITPCDLVESKWHLLRSWQ